MHPNLPHRSAPGARFLYLRPILGLRPRSFRPRLALSRLGLPSRIGGEGPQFGTDGDDRRSIRTRFDRDLDGEIDEELEETYDSDGRLVLSTHSSGSRAEIRWEDDCRTEERVWSTDGPQDVLREETLQTCDRFGDLLQLDHASYQSDGELDYIEFSEVTPRYPDANTPRTGQLTEISGEWPGWDAEPDEVARTFDDTWILDDQGRRVRFVREDSLGGTTITTTEYADRTTIRTRWNGDETEVLARETLVRDEHDRVLVEQDESIDGPTVRIETRWEPARSAPIDRTFAFDGTVTQAEHWFCDGSSSAPWERCEVAVDQSPTGEAIDGFADQLRILESDCD